MALFCYTKYMATLAQLEFIRDLAIQKLKEFKEFRELLTANEITSSDTALNANNLSEAVNALTDSQASQVIDALQAKPEPFRDTTYSDKRIKQASDLLDEILTDIDNWSFS